MVLIKILVIIKDYQTFYSIFDIICLDISIKL